MPWLVANRATLHVTDSCELTERTNPTEPSILRCGRRRRWRSASLYPCLPHHRCPAIPFVSNRGCLSLARSRAALGAGGGYATPTEREFVIDNLPVRIRFLIVMIRWTGLAPLESDFRFPGSLISAFLYLQQLFEGRVGSADSPTAALIDPAPYTLHPAPYTLHSAPFTLHPTPYTLHPTLNPEA